MRRADWERKIEKLSDGHPLVCKKQLRGLGYGDDRINKLVAGLDRYPGGRGKAHLYAVSDVAERMMENIY